MKSTPIAFTTGDVHHHSAPRNEDGIEVPMPMVIANIGAIHAKDISFACEFLHRHLYSVLTEATQPIAISSPASHVGKHSPKVSWKCVQSSAEKGGLAAGVGKSAVEAGRSNFMTCF